MSENKHSCRIGTIIKKPEPNIGFVTLAPSSYWLPKPKVKEQKPTAKKNIRHQKSQKIEGIIVLVLFVALSVMAGIDFYLESNSREFYYCVAITVVLIVVILLILSRTIYRNNCRTIRH